MEKTNVTFEELVESRIITIAGSNWYDANGNCIHYYYFDENECWSEYDERGNEIHCKFSDGFEYWRQYDNNGNVIYHTDSDGRKKWYKYDKNNRLAHCYDSNGIKEWFHNGDRITEQEYNKLYNNKGGKEMIDEKKFKVNVLKSIIDLKDNVGFDNSGREVYRKSKYDITYTFFGDYTTKILVTDLKDVVQKEISQHNDGYREKETITYPDGTTEVTIRNMMNNAITYNKDRNGTEVFVEYKYNTSKIIHLKQVSKSGEIEEEYWNWYVDDKYITLNWDPYTE